MEICYIPLWERTEVEADPQTLYIFGDNDTGRGKSGQAVIRGLNNAIGIPTKRLPSLRQGSFYSDEDYLEHSSSIIKAVNTAIDRCKSGSFKRLALPKDGLGTGLAQLNSRAPLVFACLNREVDRLVSTVQAMKFDEEK